MQQEQEQEQGPVAQMMAEYDQRQFAASARAAVECFSHMHLGGGSRQHSFWSSSSRQMDSPSILKHALGGNGFYSGERTADTLAQNVDIERCAAEVLIRARIANFIKSLPELGELASDVERVACFCNGIPLGIGMFATERDWRDALSRVLDSCFNLMAHKSANALFGFDEVRLNMGQLFRVPVDSNAFLVVQGINCTPLKAILRRAMMLSLQGDSGVVISPDAGSLKKEDLLQVFGVGERGDRPHTTAGYLLHKMLRGFESVGMVEEADRQQYPGMRTFFTFFFTDYYLALGGSNEAAEQLRISDAVASNLQELGQPEFYENFFAKLRAAYGGEYSPVDDMRAIDGGSGEPAVLAMQPGI